MATEADGQLAGLRVLVVDDSGSTRRAAERALEAAGCRVATAADGFDALAEVVDHRPDIIFVDVAMPRLDGYQLCALVRASEAAADIPVVLLAGGADRWDRARARAVGADGMLEKPIDGGSLTAAVARHLRAGSPGAGHA